MFRQYTLVSEDGSRRTVGWLETAAPLKKGARLTTKEHGPDCMWTVEHVGRIACPDPPNRTWRVGGLG